MQNLNAFVKTNKQIAKGVQTPNSVLDALVEQLKNIR